MPMTSHIDWTTVTELRCGKCGDVKTTDEFSPNARGQGRCRPWQYWCKQCFADRSHEKVLAKHNGHPYTPSKKINFADKVAATGLKYCTICKYQLSIDEFYGRMVWCKLCFRKRRWAKHHPGESFAPRKKVNSIALVVVTGMKYCSKCNSRKPINEFGTQKAKLMGLSTWCKPCTASYMRESNKLRARERRAKAKQNA